jgi:hypothetical protein
MQSRDKSICDFNSSPEDKELNQFYSEIEIPEPITNELRPITLFASNQIETTLPYNHQETNFASRSNRTQETAPYHQDHQEQTLLPIDTLIRKRKKMEVNKVTESTVLDDIDNLDSKISAIYDLEQSKNEIPHQKKKETKGITATLPNGAICIFPKQKHFGPNSFGLIIDTTNHLITIKVEQSEEVRCFTVEVLYQFIGMPTHSFKFSHCPVPQSESEVPKNIETINKFL